MKKITLIALAVGLVSWCGSLPAVAQVSLKADFTMTTSFYVGGAKLPPGKYTIRQSQDDPTIYSVINSTGTHNVDVVAQQSSKKSKSGTIEMIFNHYPSGEYLTGVETSVGNSITLDTGVAEKLAKKKGTPQAHSVAAK